MLRKRLTRRKSLRQSALARAACSVCRLAAWSFALALVASATASAQTTDPSPPNDSGMDAQMEALLSRIDDCDERLRQLTNGLARFGAGIDGPKLQPRQRLQLCNTLSGAFGGADAGVGAEPEPGRWVSGLAIAGANVAVLALIGGAAGFAASRSAKQIAPRLLPELNAQVAEAEQRAERAERQVADVQETLRIHKRAATVERDKLEGRLEEVQAELATTRQSATRLERQVADLSALRARWLEMIKAEYELREAPGLQSLEQVFVYLSLHKDCPHWFDDDKRLIDFYALLSDDADAPDSVQLGPETAPHEVRQQYERRVQALFEIIRREDQYTRQERKEAQERKKTLDVALEAIYGRYIDPMEDRSPDALARRDRENRAMRERYISARARFYATSDGTDRSPSSPVVTS